MIDGKKKKRLVGVVALLANLTIWSLRNGEKKKRLKETRILLVNCSILKEGWKCVSVSFLFFLKLDIISGMHYVHSVTQKSLESFRRSLDSSTMVGAQKLLHLTN